MTKIIPRYIVKWIFLLTVFLLAVGVLGSVIGVDASDKDNIWRAFFLCLGVVLTLFERMVNGHSNARRRRKAPGQHEPQVLAG